MPMVVTTPVESTEWTVPSEQTAKRRSPACAYMLTTAAGSTARFEMLASATIPPAMLPSTSDPVVVLVPEPPPPAPPLLPVVTSRPGSVAFEPQAMASAVDTKSAAPPRDR